MPRDHRTYLEQAGAARHQLRRVRLDRPPELLPSPRHATGWPRTRRATSSRMVARVREKTMLDLIRQLAIENQSKIVLLVADGLGGLPIEPGRPTELEAASTRTSTPWSPQRVRPVDPGRARHHARQRAGAPRPVRLRSAALQHRPRRARGARDRFRSGAGRRRGAGQLLHARAGRRDHRPAGRRDQHRRVPASCRPAPKDPPRGRRAVRRAGPGLPVRSRAARRRARGRDRRHRPRTEGVPPLKPVAEDVARSARRRCSGTSSSAPRPSSPTSIRPT